MISSEVKNKQLDRGLEEGLIDLSFVDLNLACEIIVFAAAHNILSVQNVILIGAKRKEESPPGNNRDTSPDKSHVRQLNNLIF